MTRKEYSFLLTLFILSTLFVAASLPTNVAPSQPSSSTQVQPLRDLGSPPSNNTGTGFNINLTGSVNGWQLHTLEAVNSFADYNHRNDSFSSGSPPPLAWQEITIKDLTATDDVREVQGGIPTGSYGCGQFAPPTYPMLAMSFTPAETVNISVVCIFYGAFLNPPQIRLHIVPDSGLPQPQPAPIAASLGFGLLANLPAAWHNVSVSTPSGQPITLVGANRYWIVMDGQLIPPGSRYDWYYVPDPPPPYDAKLACIYPSAAAGWQQELIYSPSGWNFLALIKVIPVGADQKPMKYNSPAQVGMYLNGTIPIVNNVTRVPNSYRTFVLSASTSVTFSVNWTARMEVFAAGGVTTQYIAHESVTFWNASFSVGNKPPNPYTWYNLTFKVSPIPQYWSVTKPSSNVTNYRSYPFSFVSGSGYYFITQTNNVNSSQPWNNNWLIRAKSAYKITASLPPQVVAGLSLTLNISTVPYSPSWCNVTFYNATDYSSYSRNVSIPSNSYLLTLKLNDSGVYTLFLFDRWTGGNEASLNKSLTVTVLKPLSNITVLSFSQPILGNNASVSFRFFNNTVGAVVPFINPESVKINGTNASFTYSGDVVTAVWNTTTGGWHASLNHVNVSARSGVFSNSTVTWINIIQPECVLRLDTSAMQRTWGDGMTVALQCLNTTVGAQRPFPSAPHVKVNGSDVLNLVSIGGGNYSFNYATSSLSSAGNYSLVISASYGTFYHNETILNLQLMRLPMALSITMEQTSVYVGSSLSVTATLAYSNGTSAPDGFNLQFEFTVNYKNGSVGVVSKTGAILSGVATSSLSATGDMQSMSVRVTYAGDGIRASASDTRTDIPVERPAGLPIMVILGIGGGSGALVVFSVLVLRYRGARKRTEARKVLVLKQSASLAQLIVVHLGSGRCVFSRGLGSEDDVDPNLISGFLSANQAILGEVFKKKGGAGLKFADYGDYKVVSHLGKSIMSTLFCTETAGEELKSVLEKFTEKFEKRYAKVLETWDGDMNVFKDADDIADDVFALPLCAPYTLMEEVIAKERFNGIEKKVLDEARKISAERGIFFMPRIIDFLLTKQGVRRSTILDLINSLTRKGVIKQLNVKEAAELISNGSITVEADR